MNLINYTIGEDLLPERRINGLINLAPIMIETIRKVLSENENIYGGEHRFYTGLCDTSICLAINYINLYNKKFNDNIKVESFHGELVHSPLILKRYWMYQHTWGILYKENEKPVYIDPTSEQFYFAVEDIPDFYYGYEAPKWYLPDDNNLNVYIWRLEYNGKISKRLEKILDKTIAYYTYYIYGTVCDMIYAFKENISYLKDMIINNIREV